MELVRNLGKEIGITKGYPRIKKKVGKLAIYLQLCRPFTLLPPLLAGFFGTLAFDSSLILAAYVGITFALCQATGQIINQYADIELDKLAKPYRPLPSDKMSKEEAMGLAWLFAILSISRAFTVNEIFGCGILALIFFAVFYSLSPFSPRRINPFLNASWMAISRGFIPVMIIWSLAPNILEGIPYALIASIWVMGFQSTKDIEDIEADKRFCIKTIFRSYGYSGLTRLMIFCTCLYIFACFIFELHLLLALFPIALISIKYCRVKSQITENTIGWIGFYAGLGLFFILMLSQITLL